MQNVNAKLKIALIVMVNLVSVVALTWFLNTKDIQPTKAADGYTGTWTKKQCRLLDLTIYGIAGTLDLGVAEWEVVYTKPGATDIKEKWAATSWVNRKIDSAKIWGTNLSRQNFRIGSCNNITYLEFGVYAKIFTMGEYGVAAWDSEGDDEDFFGAVSIPNGWTVTQL